MVIGGSSFAKCKLEILVDIILTHFTCSLFTCNEADVQPPLREIELPSSIKQREKLSLG